MLVRSDTGRVLDLAWDTVAGKAVPFGGDCTNLALEGENELPLVLPSAAKKGITP